MPQLVMSYEVKNPSLKLCFGKFMLIQCTLVDLRTNTELLKSNLVFLFVSLCEDACYTLTHFWE